MTNDERQTAFKAGRDDALEDVARLLDDALSGDGWDIGVLEDIDQLLARNGHRTAGVDDTFTCSECGCVGNIDDGCREDGPCPDLDCVGSCIRNVESSES